MVASVEPPKGSGLADRILSRDLSLCLFEACQLFSKEFIFEKSKTWLIVSRSVFPQESIVFTIES